MNGRDLQKMAEAAGVGPLKVCHEAGINSLTTLYKIYRDDRVRVTTKVKVEHAIRRLAEKTKLQSTG